MLLLQVILTTFFCSQSAELESGLKTLFNYSQQYATLSQWWYYTYLSFLNDMHLLFLGHVMFFFFYYPGATFVVPWLQKFIYYSILFFVTFWLFTTEKCESSVCVSLRMSETFLNKCLPFPDVKKNILCQQSYFYNKNILYVQCI